MLNLEPLIIKKFKNDFKRTRGTNIAVTATARKLLTIIYAMLKNNSKYYALQVKKAS